MNEYNWYDIEKLTKVLFGTRPNKKSIVLDFESAWEKEYFFTKEEISIIKRNIAQERKKKPKQKGLMYKIYLILFPLKQKNKECRKKQLNSIKFILGEDNIPDHVNTGI